MQYNIKAHETLYAGVIFRSRLEARWAAFFDLIGWKWEYEPIDINGWTPDFKVTFLCGHSECNGSHSLLVEVKPYYHISEFGDHPCTKYTYGSLYDDNGEITETCIPADASACFGINPDVTEWEMAHGAGGGIEILRQWVHGIDIDEAWKKAGNITSYKKKA